MLEDRKTIELGDGVLLDVVPEADFVTIRHGDSKGIKVRKVDLWAACFVMADAKMQEQLLPVRQTTMATFRRIHHVKVKRPLKPGDILNVKCEVSVPQTIEEGLAGSLTKRRGKVLVPSYAQGNVDSQK